MKKWFVLLIAGFVVGIVGFAFAGSNPSEGAEKLTGNNVQKTYSVEEGKAFKVIITGDSADEQPSTGEINFLTAENVEFGFPFSLKKGSSGKWGGSPSDKVTKATITLKRGSILIKFQYKSQ